MTTTVITVGPQTSIVEAAKIMLRHHVSGLPVVDAGKLVGIISESDFIRRAEVGTQRKRGRWLSFLVGSERVASEFVHQHGRKVGEIMTPDPVTVTEDTSLELIVRVMECNNVKRLPVVRGDRLVGIVSRSDFLHAVADLARDVADPTTDNDHIRGEIIAAIEQTGARPCRLNVIVRDGVVRLSGQISNEATRLAAIVAAENVAGVKKVDDHLYRAEAYPPPEEDLGGGDFVSLQEQPSTTDDEPL